MAWRGKSAFPLNAFDHDETALGFHRCVKGALRASAGAPCPRSPSGRPLTHLARGRNQTH